MTRLMLFLSFALFMVTSPAWGNEVQPLQTQLSEQEKRFIGWIAEREAVMLDELKQHVDLNTSTDNIAGLDAYRSILQDQLIALGFETQTISSDPIEVLSCQGRTVEIADHLLATRSGMGPRLLLNGHMDTVFSPNDEFQSLSVDGMGVIRGPGVADMKGGIVVMLNALRALNAEGLLENTSISVLLNSDEEIGSLGSRALIELLAKEHDIGLVYEGTYQNKVTRARKGLGQARIRVIGREAHAGAAHQDGVSASLELAHKVIQLESLTDYDEDSTINVGVMSGGEKRNTVPGCAEAYVDMRFVSAREGERLKKKVMEIAERDHITSEQHPDFPRGEAWAVLHRPAKPVSPEVDKLIAMAMGISAEIGEPIVGTRYSGGGTDGSIAQAAGLPTLDSLGLNGLGAHSSREQTSITSLVARTQLAAVMLLRLLKGE